MAVSLEELEEREMKEEIKYSKKLKQDKRIWLSCKEKNHFSMMVPERYLQREGVNEKLLCPICGQPFIIKSR